MISVIIPVYNVESVVHYSIESVLQQKFDDCEIILVDDGSTDNSGEICETYKRLPNVNVIHKANGGLSSARNAGVNIARGEYLLFLDSDDYLRPGSIKLLSDLINSSGKFDFIQFRYDEVSDYSDNQKAESPTDLFEVTDRRRMFEEKFALGGIGASACTKLICRDVFDKLRFKEGIIHEDELFTIRLINQSSRVLYISNPLYMYVQRSGSIITSGFSKKRLDIIPVLDEQIAVLKANGYDDLADQVRNNFFTNLCVMYADAHRLKMHECIGVIRDNATAILPDVSLKRGTFGVIARGMRMHLPMLRIYATFKSICHGKI